MVWIIGILIALFGIVGIVYQVRRRKIPISGSLFVLFGLSVILAFSGGSASEGRNLSATNTTTSSSDSTPHIQLASVGRVKNGVPLTPQQMSTLLNWAEHQYEEIQSRFDGLQPSSYQVVDPGWSAYQHAFVQAVTDEENTLPTVQVTGSARDAKINHEIMVQTDVQQVLEDLYSVGADMGEYLDGGQTSGQVQQDESMFQSDLKKAQQEVASL